MYGYWSSVTWPVSDCTVSYRPVLSSERPPYRKNNKAIVTKESIRLKSGHGLQRGARYRLTVGCKINSTQLKDLRSGGSPQGYYLQNLTWFSDLSHRLAYIPRFLDAPCSCLACFFLSLNTWMDRSTWLSLFVFISCTLMQRYAVKWVANSYGNKFIESVDRADGINTLLCG
jgi:hypothetical protein